MDAFIGEVCRCDHLNQNLMVSNNKLYKNFYSRPYKIESMGVCLVTGGYYHYSGICGYGIQKRIDHYSGKCMLKG